MAIKASQVKELRELTGAGMMDCKKALTETDGDMDKAVEWLRETEEGRPYCGRRNCYVQEHRRRKESSRGRG